MERREFASFHRSGLAVLIGGFAYSSRRDCPCRRAKQTFLYTQRASFRSAIFFQAKLCGERNQEGLMVRLARVSRIYYFRHSTIPFLRRNFFRVGGGGADLA